MRLVFGVIHVVFIPLLMILGKRRMGILPLGTFALLLTRYHQRQQYLGENLRDQVLASFQNYGLAVARTIFLLALWQLADIFGLIGYSSAFRFLGIHLVGYIFAVVMKKQDLLTIAHRGRWVSGALLARQGRTYGGGWMMMDMISLWITLTMAVYGFIVFVLGALNYPFPRLAPAFLFVFLQLTILVYVTYQSDTLSVWTILGGQIYLGILYLLFQWIRHHQDKSIHAEDDEDLLQVILRGERVQERQMIAGSNLRTELWHQLRASLAPMIRYLPEGVFTTIGALNIVTMIIQLFFILGYETATQGWWREIAFWFSSIVYVMNYFVLQQQRIAVPFQRVLVFLLINFGIYLTIFHIFGSEPIYLVCSGVLRSLMSGFLMIQSRASHNMLGLSEQDYRYWLMGNLLAIGANSYFIFLLPTSAQLKFTLVILYLAIQALLLRYQIVKK